MSKILEIPRAGGALEVINEGEYYRAFDKWLKTQFVQYEHFKVAGIVAPVNGAELFNTFTKEVGVRVIKYLEVGEVHELEMIVEILDDNKWQSAKKYYGIL